MDWGVVLAALLTTVGGVITTLLMLFRNENREDHAKVMETIERIGGKLDQLDTKLGSHIEWHLKEESDGKVLGRDKVVRNTATRNTRKNTRRSA